MSTLRMTSDLRRQLILGAAKRCFARNGFAGTTTKSVAAAAAISEALLFKHFPSKAALYAEILAEECEADPDLAHLLGLEPSTATLVELIKGMVRHFLSISDGSDHEEAQRLRLMTTSHLDDGEFARLLYAKVGALIGPAFVDITRSRRGGRRRIADRRRAAQFVLVRASHRADGRAFKTAGRTLSALRQYDRSRTSALRISSPRNRTTRSRNYLSFGPRFVAGLGATNSCRKCMT